MIKTALYIRVSTAEQTLHGLSLDAQKDALTEYANRHNMQIVGTYCDEGITARKRLDKRAAFQRLIADVQQNKIDLILVTKLDRWFRNIKDYYATQEILEKHGCNWRTIFENYDTSTASGRLHINIMLSVNQDECDRTSERIKAVFRHKIEKREFISGNTPLGYKLENKQLVKDSNQSERVEFIFNHFLIHQNKTRLLLDYNDKFNTNYCYHSITNILTNEIYTGKYRDIPDFCDPYIDASTFKRVQMALKNNVREKKNKRVYVYSGLVVCQECGAIKIGSSYTKKDKTYKYYKRNVAHARQCSSCVKSVREDTIDAYILDHIHAELKKYKATFKVSDQNQYNDKKRKQIERKIKRLKELYVNELIDIQEYKADLSTYKADLERLEDKHDKNNIDAVNALLKLDIKELWQHLDLSERQALIRSVIKKITVSYNTITGIEFL